MASSGSQCRELQARMALRLWTALFCPNMRCTWKTNFSSVPHSRTLVCSSTLAHGRAWALLSSKRCTVRACTFSDVSPTCTEAGRMRMRPIEKFWWPPGATPSMCRLQCCRLFFFARLVQWGTAPLFAVLQAGDGHNTSWTTALRRDLAWLDRTEGCGEFSDPHDGDCSDWVAFARDKPARCKTRVKRAAKASILSVEAFPVSGFPVEPAQNFCGMWQSTSR